MYNFCLGVRPWPALRQAACFIPVLGIPIRMGIAGVTIEALGRSVIAHYERKHPGREFVKKPD